MLPVIENDSTDTMQTVDLERVSLVREEETPIPLASMTVVNNNRDFSPTAMHFNALTTATIAAATTAAIDVSSDFSIKREKDVISPLSPDSSVNQDQFKTIRPTSTIYGKYQEQNPNESVRSWLQRITAMQQEIQRKQQKLPEIEHAPTKATSVYSPIHQSNRIVKYQDLPYMGEMTLDNSKPRRGRKPKKADICHLIYKNYGTIFPGTPKSFVDNKSLIDMKKTVTEKVSKESEPLKRTNVQNRIISSLLEKRLTQSSPKVKLDQDEPLNLCIRDLNQLKIRLLRKQNEVYTPEVKSEPESDDDVEFIDDSSSHESTTTTTTTTAKQPEFSSSSEADTKSPDLTSPDGYVYWPNAGVFIHPMALQSQLLYYQQMSTNNNNYTSRQQEETNNTLSSSPTNREFRKLQPKHSVCPKSQEKQPQRVEDTDVNSSQETRTKRIAAVQNTVAPTKRKRSAIFIPPIPTENQTNPATEVSICKFKFTGGAKPSLQEKKMLSVDSGGNFRYYSGTGDKSMRGYEFFPREALQQQAAAGGSHGSGTGAFLQASGEKIPMIGDTMSGDKQMHPEIIFAPETTSRQTSPNSARHRKRKTLKSLQREKLEQTFKEKGFLIQTQQLESAEGATYCKFRQLRKFTRYLFRSWKDYLPGNVRELQGSERSDEDEHADALLMDEHVLGLGNRDVSNNI